MDKDTVVLLAARAARLDNQDAIDEAIINMLADPKEVCDRKCVTSALMVGFFSTIYFCIIKQKIYMYAGTC